MPYITVDIDMRDIDTDDLVEELERRRKLPESNDEVSVAQIFEQFYLGNDARATEMTKRYLQHVTGRVLPN